MNICLEGLKEKGHSRTLQIHFGLCLSVICQGGFASLEAVYRNQAMNRLIASIGDKKGEIVKSILYCVYCIVVKNYERYKFCFNNAELIRAMENTIDDNWDYWPHNVSERLMRLKNMISRAFNEST